MRGLEPKYRCEANGHALSGREKVCPIDGSRLIATNGKPPAPTATATATAAAPTAQQREGPSPANEASERGLKRYRCQANGHPLTAQYKVCPIDGSPNVLGGHVAAAPRPVAVPRREVAFFEGVTMRGSQIKYKREAVPIEGARASVDTSGAIDKRVTATRLLLTGPFAFGLRKKKDDRALFLLIEGGGSAFVVDVDPKKEKKAREFAAKVNAAGHVRPARATQSTATAAPDDPISQVKRLGELHTAGVLTDEEFAVKKAELLSRL